MCLCVPPFNSGPPRPILTKLSMRNTLACLINVHVRLLIFGKKCTLYALIRGVYAYFNNSSSLINNFFLETFFLNLAGFVYLCQIKFVIIISYWRESTMYLRMLCKVIKILYVNYGKFLTFTLIWLLYVN